MTSTTAVAPPVLGRFDDSTDLLEDPSALRERAYRDGYLFFRALLPAVDVQKVRDDVYRQLEREGSLYQRGGAGGFVNRPHVDAVDGQDMRLDIGVSRDAYVQIQQVRSIHALPHHPRLLNLYRQLFDEKVFVHPRHIVRAMTGHRELRPTPAHQDFPLIQGSQNTWTAWFPLDDCPVERGQLSVLRGSNVNGYVPIATAEGAGGLQALLCRDDVDWVTDDFRMGDVLTFPSMTIHRSIPAQSKDRIRLSMDVRFQPASEPIEAKSLTNHSDKLWPDIYKDWPLDESLRYYWESATPLISPWDDSFIQPGQRIC